MSAELDVHPCCFIVPPHLLQAIADSQDNDEATRHKAAECLESTLAYQERRRARRHRHHDEDEGVPQGIVQDDILRSMAASGEVDESTRESARTTLEHSHAGRERRRAFEQDPLAEPRGSVVRDVYDANHATSTRGLPGSLVREEGQPRTTTDDDDVNSCYFNFGRTFNFYKEVFGRASIDDKDMALVGSVHFATNYANAAWIGDQMIFGDGNNFLYHFTRSLDVIGHELTHGVTQYTCSLEYHTQSGALNESISDVFGSMVKQYAAGETAAEADWLIGEQCLFPTVKGVALRSMKAPGTAYNDPRIGKDIQPSTMSGYRDLPDTSRGDNGGVHINSGIPNHAFYLAAIGFGGHSWDKAGQVWYKTITSGKVPSDCNFKTFANITVDVAEGELGTEDAAIVKKAWQDVEVL